MAIKLPNGDILRNLQEQVQKNKEDIQRHYEIERVIADWGIRIIGQLDTWEVPTGSFEYGDAYAVGPDGGPFVFYIYTRGNPDYWFDYGAISIVGPAGPQGPAGVGERGERGSKWFIGSNAPTGDIKPNDIWLRISNDGRTDGFVYIYQNNAWALATSIIGPQGLQGETGPAGPRGPQGIQGEQGPRGYTTITRIIGSLPEGSIISDTYNPAEQPDNATVLMPVNGEQHAFVIIDGVWTDAGPYSGGSAVYANGEYQQTFDADSKVDTKNPGYTATYAVSNTGNPFMAKLAPNGVREGNSIPRYGPGGQLETADPQTAYQCANKKYVDGAIAAAHSESHHSMNLAFAKLASAYIPMEFTIPLAFLYNQFKNLPPSPGINSIGATIPLPCEFFYNIYGSWSMAFPFSSFDLFMLDTNGNNVSFGIRMNEAGAANCYISCEGTLDDETQSITFTGYIAEASTGAPTSQVKVMLILPPNISLS